MNGMVNSPDAVGDDPCTVTGIRAITSLVKDLSKWRSPSAAARRTWGRIARASTLGSGNSVIGCVSSGTKARWCPPRTDGSGPRSREGNLSTSFGAVRQAARDTDAEYQALLARLREQAQRDARAQRDRQADPAKCARLAEDQARIDAVRAETKQ
jgi:hypothetical protein